MQVGGPLIRIARCSRMRRTKRPAGFSVLSRRLERKAATFESRVAQPLSTL
jgi:hypothetical protein